MRGGPRIIAIWGGLAAIALGVAGFAFHAMQQKSSVRRSVDRPHSKPNFRHQNFESFTVWWDEIPKQVRRDGFPTGSESNIHPKDYAGPDACKNCHKKQYESWSEHPHRWMNSLVENTTIRGDFNDHRMSYLGGEVTFYQAAGQYRNREIVD